MDDAETVSLFSITSHTIVRQYDFLAEMTLSCSERMSCWGGGQPNHMVRSSVLQVGIPDQVVR